MTDQERWEIQYLIGRLRYYEEQSFRESPTGYVSGGLLWIVHRMENLIKEPEK